MPGSIIQNIKNTHCGWDNKPLGKPSGSIKGHSHKELMRCLYKSNMELRNSILKEQELEKKVKTLEGELGQYIVKEELSKEKTGTGLLTNNIEGSFPTPQLESDGQKEAKDLIESESVVDGNTK